jgi:hypothetical protein
LTAAITISTARLRLLYRVEGTGKEQMLKKILVQKSVEE